MGKFLSEYDRFEDVQLPDDSNLSHDLAKILFERLQPIKEKKEYVINCAKNISSNKSKILVVHVLSVDEGESFDECESFESYHNFHVNTDALSRVVGDSHEIYLSSIEEIDDVWEKINKEANGD